MMSAHLSLSVLQGYSLPHIDVLPDAWLGKAGSSLLIRSDALRSSPLKSSCSKLCSVSGGSLDCFDFRRRLHARRRRLMLGHSHERNDPLRAICQWKYVPKAKPFSTVYKHRQQGGLPYLPLGSSSRQRAHQVCNKLNVFLLLWNHEDHLVRQIC